MSTENQHGTRPTVLVVDDECLVRIVAADFLEDAGYDVLDAENAEHALSVLAKHDEVTVLVTDINMPGSMDGVALANAVHRIRPDIALVLTSGATFLTEEQIPDSGKFLSKPYSFQDLAKTVETVMRERQNAA